MKKIVFHSRLTSMPDKGLKLLPTSSVMQRELVLTMFEQTPEAVLHVGGIGLCVGWRTAVYDDEATVDFVGENWTREQVMQARNRLKPACLKRVNGVELV